jgi:hypothetical protein
MIERKAVMSENKKRAPLCLCPKPSVDYCEGILVDCKASFDCDVHQCAKCGRYLMHCYCEHGAVYGVHCWVLLSDEDAEIFLGLKDSPTELKARLHDWEAENSHVMSWMPVLESSSEKYFDQYYNEDRAIFIIPSG